MKLYAPSTISDLRKRYNFRLSKRLGQNFLVDQHIVDKLLEYSYIAAEHLVIEIGPGMGVLTAAAAKQAKEVIAVEIDEKLIPILKETLAEHKNIQVVHADILKTDISALIQSRKDTKGVKIIGNLPYYITTPIIMKILEEGIAVDSITVMIQREVADRILSPPGNKNYGALSVAVQYYCNPVRIAEVPKDVFIPVPNVDSTILRLDLYKEKPVQPADEAVFFACIKAGFGQRRKTLGNALTGLYGFSKGEIQEILTGVGIDPGRRAETLSIEEFGTMANEMSAHKKHKNK